MNENGRQHGDFALNQVLTRRRIQHSSRTNDVADYAKRIHRLPDESTGQTRYDSGGWVKGFGLVLQVFSFSLCYDRRCVGAGGRGFFHPDLRDLRPGMASCSARCVARYSAGVQPGAQCTSVNENLTAFCRRFVDGPIL